MKTIEIIVSATGEITIDAVGFKGADCEQATQFLEQALGVVGQKQRKPGIAPVQPHEGPTKGWLVKTLVLKFDTFGDGHCLYTEALDLSSIGVLQIARASNIEFNQESQEWEVRNAEGQLLHSHPSRTDCLDWEHQYFNR